MKYCLGEIFCSAIGHFYIRIVCSLDLRKPFVGRLSMEVTSRVISYKQTCDNRLQRTRPSLKCLVQIEPHENPAKSAKLRNSVQL